MRAADLARLLALAAIWGGSFVFMRVLAPALGAVVTAELRVVIAGLALFLYFRAVAFRLELFEHWRHHAVIGMINCAIPFLMFAYAALHIPASYSVTLNASSPLFGAALAAMFLGEPLTLRKAAGLLLGSAGVALVTGVGGVGTSREFWLGVGACLLGAACYGVGGVYIKRFAPHVEPLSIAVGSLLAAGVFLLPAVPFAPAPGEITMRVALITLAFALLCSAVAYVLYYRLIRDIGPIGALTVTFLMPAFGIAWGVLLLGERLTWSMGAGCALVVAGTYLVLARPRPRSAGFSSHEGHGL